MINSGERIEGACEGVDEGQSEPCRGVGWTSCLDGLWWSQAGSLIQFLTWDERGTLRTLRVPLDIRVLYVDLMAHASAASLHAPGPGRTEIETCYS